MPDPITTVLFDFGLVLSGPPDPAAWKRIRTLTNLEEAALHTSYWTYREAYDRGALTGAAYWQAVVAQTNTNLSPTQLEALFLADTDLWTQPNPPIIDWAARLQRAGIRTGILSNIGDAIAEGICRKLPWLAAFDHCTWSHALFMAKPDPPIYLKTAEALHTPPANILFVDDREENITAAIALGMQAIHYTDHARFETEMRTRKLDWLLDI